MKRPAKGKRPPVVIGDYLTQINKASGKPVTIPKPETKVLVVKADHRINTP